MLGLAISGPSGGAARKRERAMGNVGSNVADLEVALATVRERIAKYQRQSIEPSTAVLLGPEDFDGQPRCSAEWASCSTKSAAA